MGRPMTPIPIKLSCMGAILSHSLKIYFLCHLNERRASWDNRSFLIIDVLNLSFVRSCDGMLHFHRTQNNEYLVCLDHIAVAHLDLHDRASHGSLQCALRGNGTPTVGSTVNVGCLSSLERIGTPMHDYARIACSTLYIH